MADKKELNLEETEKVSGGDGGGIQVPDGFTPFISVPTSINISPIGDEPSSDPKNVNVNNDNENSIQQSNVEGDNKQNDVVLQN